MFEGYAGTSESGFRGEVEAEQTLQRGERLLAMIENHSDHARMEELCTLAWHVIASPAAGRALKAGLLRAPDETCRAACKLALDRFGSN